MTVSNDHRKAARSISINEADRIPSELRFRAFWAAAFFQVPEGSMSRCPRKQGEGFTKAVIAEDGTIEVAQGVTAIRFKGRPPKPGTPVYFAHEENCLAVIAQDDYEQSADVFEQGTYKRSLWLERNHRLQFLE
ncbi:hypothetical protein G6L37_04750 [Agrobacterium rubi]|nr:hypothetical protein [Agrobacterium rubi]NTF24663.1 hypothetical protein [Agrobacterium rubi]